VTILKLIRLVLILLLFIALFIFLSKIFLSSFLLVSYEEIDVYVTVEDIAGFNVNSSALYFGAIPPRGIGNRDIFLFNDDCSKCSVNLRGDGEIANWLSISDNNFVMFKGDNKTINVKVYIPSDAEYDNYTAKLKIYFWKTF